MGKPSSTRPRQKRAELTRQKIVAAGKTLFSRDGYHGTSTKKIAREAGVSVGTFYNHFTDKKDLFVTIYLEHGREVHEMIFSSLAAGGFAAGAADGRQLVRTLIESTLELHTLSPEFHRQMIIMQYSDEEIAALVARKEQEVTRTLVELLAAGGSALRVEDIEAAARVVTIAVEEVVHAQVLAGPGNRDPRLIDALADMIHRFLYA